MKRTPALLSVLMLLSLSACNLQMPRSQAPTAAISITDTPFVAVAEPTDTLVPAPLPTNTESAPAPTAAAPTVEPPAAAPPTPPPTPSPAAVDLQSAAIQPTAEQPAPTATPTSAKTFDPDASYGKPSYENPMHFPNLGEWAQAETKLLPNNRNIRLQFKDGELYVTGKRPDFSTWWFSYHNLSDAYIEMTFETENCSGEDAYGIIFRGPPHLAGISYGYVVSFTCNGRLWVFRLDDANPWEAETLIDEEQVGAINTGPDDENVIGVRTEGERFVIFANGIQVAEVEDDHFEKGRVGVFVRAARLDAYTYRLTNFAYWILGADE